MQCWCFNYIRKSHIVIVHIILIVSMYFHTSLFNNKVKKSLFWVTRNYRAIMHLHRYAATQSPVHRVLPEEVRSLMFSFLYHPKRKRYVTPPPPHNKQVWRYTNDYLIFQQGQTVPVNVQHSTYFRQITFHCRTNPAWPNHNNLGRI